MARRARPTKHYSKWRIRFIDEQGVRRSEVYDSYRAAEIALNERLVLVEQIKRGLIDAPPETKSFDDLCDYWLKNRTPFKRRSKDDESIIRKHLRPTFGHLKIKEVNTERIDLFKIDRQNLNNKTLSNILTLLISMLNCAHDLGWLPRVPKVKKPSVKILQKNFRYLRTQEEIDRFLSSARSEGTQVYALYATAIYTGLREGELAGLQWDDVDFERRLIAVQRSFTGPTKSGEARFVPILDPLLPILQIWYEVRINSIVFPNQANRIHSESSRIFQETLKRVLTRAGFPQTRSGDKVRHYVTFHGLRHTFASHWMMNGGDLFKLQNILGHQDHKMTQRYAHLAPHAFASDYKRLGNHSLASLNIEPSTNLGKILTLYK